ncbi:serine/threonine protein kinase [bacterium]|nr:serine/threonine protein kinase [bacterium]
MDSVSEYSSSTEEEQFFYSLDPQTVLTSVERIGFRTTGKILPLNSFENRVYQVEIEATSREESVYDTQKIAKFYRLNRWSEEQIREEHEFLSLLSENGIPVVRPLLFPDGDTLQTITEHSIWFCVSPKVGGRHQPELPPEHSKKIGRILAQIHNIGSQVSTRSRKHLTAETYGDKNISYLCDSPFLPKESQTAYRSVVEPIVAYAKQRLTAHPQIRLHGDCHLGNVLWQDDQPIILDFDDMLYGPAVQDIWLVNPGRDEDSRKRQDLLLEGYDELRTFDYGELSLIELLRALRILHFQTWIAKRWQDPTFPKTFDYFGTPQYWRNEIAALQEISELLTTP